MSSLFGRFIKKAVQRFGYDIVPYAQDFDTGMRSLITRVEPFTMTSHARLFALREAIKYIVANRIPGSIVECGVWKGGSMMAAALTLIEQGDLTRDLYLYDTFEGLPAPGERDKTFCGDRQTSAAELVETHGKNWCYASYQEVYDNLLSTGYPPERLHCVTGRVEETLKQTRPRWIALLRLDTDWYESTKCEMEYLYPLLAGQGVLILDDYGFWQGARDAVDEYMQGQAFVPFLSRIDSSARVLIKPPAGTVGQTGGLANSCAGE